MVNVKELNPNIQKKGTPALLSPETCKKDHAFQTSPTHDTHATLKCRWGVKFISQSVKKALSKFNPSSFLLNSYKKSLRCSSAIQSVPTTDGSLKAITTYCRQRWCVTCNRIRSGHIIKLWTYLFEQHRDNLQLLTLTAKTIPGSHLKKRLGEMAEVFTACVRKTRRDGYGLTAFRKLEVTQRPPDGRGDLFHPHYHVVVSGREAAAALRRTWVTFGRKRWGNEAVSPLAQDLRTCKPSTVKEVLKYATKLTISPKSVGASDHSIPGCNNTPQGLDVIFRALRRRRTMQAYGEWYNLGNQIIKDAEDMETYATLELPEGFAPFSVFVWNGLGWFNIKTGQKLTSRTPTKKELNRYGWAAGVPPPN